jgi:NCS1 family nucleobase:cation symporter-1
VKSSWTAVTVTLLGALVAVGYSTPGSGPFPEAGLIPLLKPVYDYSWVAGLIVGFVVYVALERGYRPRRMTPRV